MWDVVQMNMSQMMDIIARKEKGVAKDSIELQMESVSDVMTTKRWGVMAEVVSKLFVQVAWELIVMALFHSVHNVKKYHMMDNHVLLRHVKEVNSWWQTSVVSSVRHIKNTEQEMVKVNVEECV